MAALIVPACLLVLTLLVGPMLLMLRISLNQFSPTQMMVEAVSADNYIRAVSDPYYQQVLLVTLGVALLCTLLTLALGFPAAYWLARMENRWKSLLTILTLFPLLVGNVVRSAGWMALLGNDGFINHTLLSAGLITRPLQLMYTPYAVVIGIIAVVLPYMVLTLASVIESIPRDVEEAAANLGGRPGTVFQRVLLPLALPGVAAGSILVFVLCMNTYATAILLGGPQFKMMAPAVYDQFIRANNWPFGAALAFILLTFTMIFSIVGSYWISQNYKR